MLKEGDLRTPVADYIVQETPSYKDRIDWNNGIVFVHRVMQDGRVLEGSQTVEQRERGIPIELTELYMLPINHYGARREPVKIGVDLICLGKNPKLAFS